MNALRNAFMPNSWARVSSPIAIVTLLLNNLIPLLGVLFWGWELYSVILLYWVENGVIGLFNVLKMALARGEAKLTPQQTQFVEWIGPQSMPVLWLVARVMLIGFFIFHYGIFWLVHGVFVVMVFGLWPGFSHNVTPDFSSTFLGLPTPFGLLTSPGALPTGILGAVGAMFISHAASFVRNYIGHGEFEVATPRELMSQPYTRVFVLHLTVIGGAFIVVGLGQPLYGLMLLVVLKTIVDLNAHLREHKRYQTALRPSLPLE